MTIRPLRVDVSNIHRYRIQTHRGEKIANDIKIPDNFWIKLYSYPVTAFGYTDGITLDEKDKINPKFDRNDVIKALDFWIEYWVYENKKDYILEDTVNKDFELTVRELIEFREAVLKEKADTWFVRQKIRPETTIKAIDENGKKTPISIFDKHIIEFTENVVDNNGNSSASTVDQFCYKVRTMTYREYMQMQKARQTAHANGSITFDWNENFTDDGTRWNFAAGALPTPPIEAPMQGGNPNPNLTADQIMNLLIARHATTIDPVITRWIETRTFVMTDDMGQLIPSDMLDFHIDPGHITFASGEVGEVLNPGDIITLDHDNRWVKVPTEALTNRLVSGGIDRIHHINIGNIIRPLDGLDHLLHSNLHPGIPAASSTDSDDIMTYENMAIHIENSGSMLGDNSFITVPMIFQGLGQNRINMDVCVESGRIIDDVNTFDTNHTVRIRQNSLEIDGQLYRATDIHIQHDPRHRSIRFNNLWIESVNITASAVNITASATYTMTVNFLQTGNNNNVSRTNLGITFTQPIRGEFMRQKFNANQQLPYSLQILGNNRVWIGHTDTEEGDVYNVEEPLEININ